ncbi:MAG TPA: TA0938 family protein [Thermoplasmata archaeon]|nr:TA0938 family protein [Thermoplasmata archaeon]
MKRNYDGCAICNSTWGNVWAEVDGERLFFCCDLCVVQYRGLLERIQRETGWSTIDSIEIAGDRRGRTCDVTSGKARERFLFAFTPEGALLRFQRSVRPSVNSG